MSGSFGVQLHTFQLKLSPGKFIKSVQIPVKKEFLTWKVPQKIWFSKSQKINSAQQQINQSKLIHPKSQITRNLNMQLPGKPIKPKKASKIRLLIQKILYIFYVSNSYFFLICYASYSRWSFSQESLYSIIFCFAFQACFSMLQLFINISTCWVWFFVEFW